MLFLQQFEKFKVLAEKIERKAPYPLPPIPHVSF